VQNVQEVEQGLSFEVASYQFTCPLLGAWNIENIMAAFGVGIWAGLSYPQLQTGLATFGTVPGRMEIIDTKPFTIVVDYAHEPTSLSFLYQFWRRRIGTDHKLITLISSTGGGRDLWRRQANGKIAGELCDYVIVTNEDPYDDDPQEIITTVAQGVEQAQKVEGQTYWKILDRQAAIEYACRLAQPGDVVLLTAKGAEQVMCLAKGKKIPWDDRKVARQVLQSLGYN
jgi:UDP-N-acetylmuramoyl-L-alanyl-D-glutamate--2,6-diaminopimelate ligase